MSECVVCEEVITQPICGECLGREIGTWLCEKFPESQEHLLTLQHLSEEILVNDDACTCIICKRDMGVCSYCYTEHIFHWVKRYFPELVAEYLIHFSYDADHLGYERGVVV